MVPHTLQLCSGVSIAQHCSRMLHAVGGGDRKCQLTAMLTRLQPRPTWCKLRAAEELLCIWVKALYECLGFVELAHVLWWAHQQRFSWAHSLRPCYMRVTNLWVGTEHSQAVR